ncbi:Endonuclease/exonuclease/phosphatase [Lactarius indigo]|nr:Endonuclease/exonuclease/phosphatase [Lactarius indigo]
MTRHRSDVVILIQYSIRAARAYTRRRGNAHTGTHCSGSERLLVQIASYNTALQGLHGVPQDLVDWLSPTLKVSNFLSRGGRAPDIVAVGFQELLPLHQGLAGLSSAVIQDRNALILSQLEIHAPNRERYTLVAKVVNVGVALLVYALDEGVSRHIRDVQTQWTGCGPAFMGNKGAVGVRFRIQTKDDGPGESYTFVCAHLTAHANKLAARIADYHHIVGSLLFSPPPGNPSGKPTTMYSTSHLFFLGDLNFRLALPQTNPYAGSANFGSIEAALDTQSGREELKEFDQLLQERRKGTVFQGFREGEFWSFKCSYKFKIGEVDKYRGHPPGLTGFCIQPTSDSSDTVEDSAITEILYTTIPSYTTSDHKPVVALLLLPPAPIVPPSGDHIPLLSLPLGFSPRPDPFTGIKKYTGRVLDRIIGIAWWLLVVVGVVDSSWVVVVLGVCLETALKRINMKERRNTPGPQRNDSEMIAGRAPCPALSADNMSHTVDIPQELKDSIRKFRFTRHKGNAALVVKINKQKLIMEEVERLDDISIEDLAEELPEASPRYIVLSYTLVHKDGRTSSPLALINWAPACETSLLTLHASALIDFQNTVEVSKVLEVRDGAEGLTKSILEAKLLS